MSTSIEELWDRSHKVFLSSLERFNVQPNPSSSLLKSSILPIHGAKLGNISQSTSLPSGKEQEFKLRARREKALYDIQTALAGLQEAFDKCAEKDENMKQALAVYQKIASNISLDTAPEQLQLYYSILSVKPYDF